MPVYAIAAAIMVAMIWGGNFAAARVTMVDFPPYLMLLLRFIAVTLLLAPFAMRRKLPRLRDMAVLSVTLIVLQFALVFTAMHMGLSITSAIIALQMGVPFACMMAAIFFKDYLGPWRATGLMVAFMGVVIVAGTPNASEHWVGFLTCIGGAFSWSASNIYMKRIAPTSVVNLLFWPALFSLPQLAALTWLLEENQLALIQAAKPAAWVGIAYSTLCSSIVGSGVWNYLIRTYPMSQVVPYSLLVPVAGIAVGALMFHEALTTQIMMGAVLTIIGVGIISLRRPQLVEAEQ